MDLLIAGEALSKNSEHNNLLYRRYVKLVTKWIQQSQVWLYLRIVNIIIYYMGIMLSWLQMDPTIAGMALSKNSEHNYLLYGHNVKLVTNGSHNRM